MKGLIEKAVPVIMFFMLVTLPLGAAEYKKGEIIVKFKHDTFNCMKTTGEQTQEPTVIAVEDTKTALEELRARGDVEYAEPNYIVTAEEVPDDWGYRSSEWEDVKLPQAWDFIHDTGHLVKIAVIDSGVDADHPDLEAVLGQGYDFANNDSTPEDDAGHGTRVCGIIAATGNNDKGYAGVAWNVDIEIMPLKFMKKSGTRTTGYISDAIDAIYYAVDHNADIINASWGFDNHSNALRDAIEYARANGVLFIASAGNSGENNDEVPHYPSNYTMDNVIAVAAMSRYGDLASFSNYGYYSVDVAAPGQYLKTTDIDGAYRSSVSGTSFAAPFVSGIAALVIADNPTLGYSEVRDRLVKTTVLDENYSTKLLNSGGCIDAYGALLAEDMHETPSKKDWNPPTSQEADAGAVAVPSGGGGGGGGCFIETAYNGTASILMILGTLFLVLRPKRQE